MKIGIVGLGCVGKAYANIVRNPDDLFVYDIRRPTQYDLNNYANWCASLDELLEHSDIVLLCLPTPEGPDGRANVSAHLQTLRFMNESPHEASVVIKSTITPDILDSLFKEFKSLKIAYSPEFLREATAQRDLIETDMHFVAGNEEACEDYQKFIRESKTLHDTCHIVSSYKLLSVMKYSINTFLATKVTFFNCLYDICERENIDYDELVTLVKKDPRMGTSHMNVPGPDGSRGFGGMCFPKDTMALNIYSLSSHETLEMRKLLDTVLTINYSIKGR